MSTELETKSTQKRSHASFLSDFPRWSLVTSQRKPLFPMKLELFFYYWVVDFYGHLLPDSMCVFAPVGAAPSGACGLAITMMLIHVSFNFTNTCLMCI